MSDFVFCHTECNFLQDWHPPCKHKFLVTHAEKGVEITCKKCKAFTIYTSVDDVGRVINIFKSAEREVR